MSNKDIYLPMFVVQRKKCLSAREGHERLYRRPENWAATDSMEVDNTGPKKYLDREKSICNILYVKEKGTCSG